MKKSTDENGPGQGPSTAHDGDADEMLARVAATERAIEIFSTWLDDQLPKLIARFPQRRQPNSGFNRRRPKPR